MRLEELNALIINLPERIDRRAHIEKEIQKLPVKWEIVEGIRDGSGTCRASQKKCIQIAKERGWPQVLIFEDDCFFKDGAVEVIEKFFENLPEKWDMLYFGANLQAPAIAVNDHVVKLTGAWTAHAYMINAHFYDFLLTLPDTCEMDVHYRWLMPNHDVFMCLPPVAYQIPSASDLSAGFKDYIAEMDYNYTRFLPKSE